MADQTTSSIVIAAPAEQIMAVIADFEAYPQWADSVRECEVEQTDSDGRPSQVRFRIDAGPIRDTYSVAYAWSGSEVRWHLVQSSFLREMDGAYVLSERPDDSTEVTYRLAVDVVMPMIGMLKRKAERVIVDTALKGLKQRVEGDEAGA